MGNNLIERKPYMDTLRGLREQVVIRADTGFRRARLGKKAVEERGNLLENFEDLIG